MVDRRTIAVRGRKLVVDLSFRANNTREARSGGRRGRSGHGGAHSYAGRSRRWESPKKPVHRRNWRVVQTFLGSIVQSLGPGRVVSGSRRDRKDAVSENPPPRKPHTRREPRDMREPRPTPEHSPRQTRRNQSRSGVENSSPTRESISAMDGRPLVPKPSPARPARGRAARPLRPSDRNSIERTVFERTWSGNTAPRWSPRSRSIPLGWPTLIGVAVRSPRGPANRAGTYVFD